MTFGLTLETTCAPGMALARGVCRYLCSLNFAPLCEFSPCADLRVDVIALGPKGEIWIVECKSSRSDYLSDRKWHSYLPWCDRFFWSVAADFPLELLPEDTGLIVGDAFAAEELRPGPQMPLPPARRKSLTREFARQSALRLAHMRDPNAASGVW